MLWIVDGGMINLPVVARVEDFKEDAYIEITGANENHEWKSEPTRYENVVRCKECIHFEPFRPTDGFCKISGMINTLEFFCADGEVKNDE